MSSCLQSGLQQVLLWAEPWMRARLRSSTVLLPDTVLQTLMADHFMPSAVRMHGDPSE